MTFDHLMVNLNVLRPSSRLASTCQQFSRNFLPACLLSSDRRLQLKRIISGCFSDSGFAPQLHYKVKAFSGDFSRLNIAVYGSNYRSASRPGMSAALNLLIWLDKQVYGSQLANRLVKQSV